MERAQQKMWGDRWRNEHSLDGGDRAMAAVLGFGVALCIPVVANIAIILWDLAVTRTRLFHTRGEIEHERDQARDRELDAYRRQAREFGLPIPDVPNRADR
jgi:hypothetical protein